MKKLKLNLDELSRELEILDVDYLKGIKGGYGTPDGGDDDRGYGGYGTSENPIELDPVEIYGVTMIMGVVVAGTVSHQEGCFSHYI